MAGETVYGRQKGSTLVRGAKTVGTAVPIPSRPNFDADESVIIVCLVAATSVTYINKIATKQPVTVKPLISMFVAGTILLGVGTWSPPTASAFALLLLVTTLVLNGKTLFDTLAKVS